MKIVRFPFLALLMLTVMAGCTQEAEMVTFEKELYCTWQIDPSLPSGGIIIGKDPDAARGEGSAGRITVEMPMPAPDSTGIIELTKENLSMMDLTIHLDDGETLHFGDEDIDTASYRFRFTHEFEPGSSRTIVITNNLP